MQKARGSLKGEGGSNPDELAAGWDTGLETPFAAKAETPARRMAKANNTNENVPSACRETLNQQPLSPKTPYRS